MRQLFMTILMVAICLTGFRVFIADGSTGIWGDANKVKGMKDNIVTTTTIPGS